MPVKKSADGKRSISVEVEVPGSPEEVWAAIATGPGITSWFMPTTVEEREGGIIECDFGPGMKSISTVTEWQPPSRLAAESDDLGPGAPTVATEWIVEAKSGDTCVVRVVHSLFADDDDWDDQLESFESGWPYFFDILRLYLAHFGGNRGVGISARGITETGEDEAWEALSGALGLAGAQAGDRIGEPAEDTPPFAGTVDAAGGERTAHVVLDEPCPGIGSPVVQTYGGQVHVNVNLFYYGDDCKEIAARDQPRWQAWMEKRFSPPGSAEAC